MKKVINMINPSSKVAGVSLVELKKTEKALLWGKETKWKMACLR